MLIIAHWETAKAVLRLMDPNDHIRPNILNTEALIDSVMAGARHFEAVTHRSNWSTAAIPQLTILGVFDE